MKFIASFVVGVIFGFGLIISGMTNPAKVLNFLDIFGTWDPSLAFVMIGAIAVTLPGYALLKKRSGPLFARRFNFPQATDLDARLIGGSAIFGIGWGIAGFCPGPALVSTGTLAAQPLIFVAAMLVGMWITRIIMNLSTPRLQAS